MSVSYRVQDQVLRVDDRSEAVEAKVHRFDAFLNLLCAGRYAFQRDAVHDVWRFLVSEKYSDTERLIRENWNVRPEIARRCEQGLEAYLNRVPLRPRSKFWSPDDYTGFFDAVRNGTFPGWQSGLMAQLAAAGSPV